MPDGKTCIPPFRALPLIHTHQPGFLLALFSAALVFVFPRSVCGPCGCNICADMHVPLFLSPIYLSTMMIPRTQFYDCIYRTTTLYDVRIQAHLINPNLPQISFLLTLVFGCTYNICVYVPVH
jgi:hypothetical protein